MATGFLLPIGPLFQAFSDQGVVGAGYKINTYVGGSVSTPVSTWTDATLTVLNPNPIILGSNGRFQSVNCWVPAGQLTKLVLTDNNNNVLTGGTIDNVPGMNDLSVSLTAAAVGAAIWPTSPAETAAGLSLGSGITTQAYAWGDMRRYATFSSGGGDITTALANNCAQAQKAGGSPVYIPAAMGSCTVTAGVTLTGSITVYGDGKALSSISTSSDITIFTLNNQASPGCTFRDFQMNGKGRTVVTSNPAFKMNGSPENSWIRMRVVGFAYVTYFATSTGSCYLNSIIDSEMISSYITNIYCQSQTHQLTMHKVTFGATYTGPGLYLTDSAGLSIVGGDCESCGVGSGSPPAVAIDLDNNVSTYVNGAHVISGVDFEANNLTVGEIRIGVSHNVHAVNVFGCTFSFGAVTPALLVANNAVNCTFFGNNIQTGYTTILSLNATNTVGFKAFSNDGAAGTPANADYLFNQCAVYSQVSTTESAGAGVSINCALGNQFIVTVTDNTAFAVNAPNNAQLGQRITITIRNTAGGALGSVTWNAIFKGGTLWASPANGNSRSVDYQYNGTNWILISQTAADVPN
jgi:hypothetical protein